MCVGVCAHLGTWMHVTGRAGRAERPQPGPRQELSSADLSPQSPVEYAVCPEGRGLLGPRCS